MGRQVNSKAALMTAWQAFAAVMLCAGILLGAAGRAGLALGRERGPGTGEVTALLRGVPITVYTYHPPSCAEPALLIVFHGLKRNPSRARESAQSFADRNCMIIFAPLIDEERFPTSRYQRGGIVEEGQLRPTEQWTVWLASDLVTWARLEEDRPNAPYYLFGHSAGAQFLSRVAAFTAPRDARRIVIANPSTYVLPSTKEPVPYGFGRPIGPSAAEGLLQNYLALPITIFLGEDDTGEENLAQSAQARKQGETRFDRGLFAFEMARTVARENRWDFGWRLVKVRDVGHSTEGMLDSPEATDAFRSTEAAVAQ